MLDELQKVCTKQNALMLVMGNESCDDIHSVLRSKQLAENVIELEVKKQLLIDLISKQKS
jgi:hypothetical protein